MQYVVNQLNYLKPYLPLLVGAVLFLFINIDAVFAQCPMCKAAAEANLKEGGSHANGLNVGILYLFITPYLIVAGIAGVWWWHNKKVAEEEVDELVQQVIEETI